MKKTAALPLLVLGLILAASSGTHLTAQWAGGTTTGADVIVGDIDGVSDYTNVGGIDAFSCGTTSCNIGDTPLDWIDGTNLHPVIGQNAFRLHNGRFEQIGQSWLKHGFLALNQNLCDTCQPTPTTSLGVGCSDPYSSALNGDQARLGPKFEVNAATGFYLWPYTGMGVTGSSIYKRLQIATSDLSSINFPGASYFIEAQYVAHDDCSDGNSANSVSYRPCSFSGSGANYSLNLNGTTVRAQPAINAWAAADPNVNLQVVDIPNDGRFNCGLLITDNGNGTWTYEYAIHNQTSDRSAFRFEIPTGPGATITGLGFHDVEYHSGEPFTGIDWTSSVDANGKVTFTTDDFATDNNANAIRWATMYNFRFTTDVAAKNPTLHLFKPGTPSSVIIPFVPPPFTYAFPNGMPATIAENGGTMLQVDTVNNTGAPDPTTGMLFISINGGTFSGSPLTNLGGGSFEAPFPALPCGSSLDWYITMDPAGGGDPVTEPANAPANFHTAPSDGVPIVLVSDNVATDQGFTASGNATDGHWERGIPVNNDRLDPTTDSDGNGWCWLTNNTTITPDSDVDNGTATLTSPVYDLFELFDAHITFDLWYMKDGSDDLQIEITNDGVNWVLVENITSSLPGWTKKDIRVADHVVPTKSVQFRIHANDVTPAEIVEAGLDNIQVTTCPFLNETIAAGTVGVGAGLPAQSVFKIGGSDGGPLRRVAIGPGVPFSIDLDQPLTNPFPAQFIIWGKLFRPALNEEFDIGGGVGKMHFAPLDAAPNNPYLFLLTDNSGFSPYQMFLASHATPWTTGTFPGLFVEINSTMQGIVVDFSAPQTLGITNAIHFRISGQL